MHAVHTVYNVYIQSIYIHIYKVTSSVAEQHTHMQQIVLPGKINYGNQ